jgi:hypothetical protein
LSSSASINPGLSDLLQTLSAVNSPVLTPVLSSPNALAALEKASPSDIVILSSQALELQQVSEMFGDSDTIANDSADPMANLFASLEAAESAPEASPAAGSSAAGSTGAATNELASDQAQFQQQELQALLGMGVGGYC